MKTDLTGADNVISYIRQSKLTKFRINRPNAHKNSAPVFEHNDSKSTNEKAIESFLTWANYTDNSIAYEMELSNNLEECQENEIESSTKKGKTIRITFCINSERDQLPANNYSNASSGQNVAELIELALLKQQTKQNESSLIERLNAMDAKINAALETDDFEDEEGYELSGLNNPNVTALIGMLGKLFNQQQKSPVINGANSGKVENIKKAINILSKHDPDLDSDLLKLANLAETNNATFNLLLNSLRSM